MKRYDEKEGKIIITKQTVRKALLSQSFWELVILGIIAMVISAIFIPCIFGLLTEYSRVSQGFDTALKYQIIGQKLSYYGAVIFCVALPAFFIIEAIRSLLKYIRLRNKGFIIDVDDVNYLDSKLVRSRRHNKEILIINFFKYGKYVTNYRFDEDYAKHKEEFYVAVSKSEQPEILAIYRRSKYEYKE